MNFLAHAWLARGGNDAFLYGNLIADGVKGNPDGDWAAEIARGIRHHRRVDAWVDDHAVIRGVRERAPRPQRRVVGIALDLVWDHFVARDHADAALIARCYRVLHAQGRAPSRLAPMIPALIEDDWLSRYADFDFTCHAIAGLGRRLSGPNRLAELVPWLRTDYPALEHDFHVLWPALNKALSAD
ncbi:MULTISPECIES: acyl carrier protein phosphodiesterase [Chromohalobacter]|uniref:ACP phosphodiesterase n=2 Tax=Chromohalobacter TaxID=42054 RepID=A0A1Q8TCG0_9GAMM|nr:MULTISPECIES: ACP phosphodiesterase [Chromohalobacter]MCK0753435.1 ACP phosphodiesterase [Chromohalobacter japonicus]MCK0766161.1 ACP phosphodiesterase [Chromohalobacter beijerinckii]OLO11356.1 ACP phosphodiesterase [Chromohalobacter japonicus]